MDERDWLAERFEAHRAHLRAVAYRMLGSLSEADDAVQDAWLRFSKSGADGVDNLRGWLTTMVARASLDILRAHSARREEPLDEHVPEPAGDRAGELDPEHEVLLADSVGVALLVVLDTLSPAERLAFVLHDTFAVPFEQIGSILGRSPAAARQLASRARRRVRGATPVREADLARQRAVVDAFLAAARDGDLDTLVSVLDPDVVLRGDGEVRPARVPFEIRGARRVAEQSVVFAPRRVRFGYVALVDGAVGVVVAPRGRLFAVMRFTIVGGRITEIDVVGDPVRLHQLHLAVVEQLAY